MKRIVFIITFILLAAQINAQQLTFNLNKTNGLPTNNVYCAIVDHNGYLWMGTEDGVLKYNGYSVRRFDYDDGLPNVDVWNLYEDNKGRIILFSIANGMGYIKNDKYYPFTINGLDTNKYIIIPAFYQEYGDTAFFWNKSGSNYWLGCMGMVVNDNVYLKDMAKIEFESPNIFIYSRIGPVIIDSSVISTYVKYNDNNYKHTILCNAKKSLINTDLRVECDNIGDNMVRFQPNHNMMEWINLYSCSIDTVYLPAAQKILYLYIKDNRECIVKTQDSIYVYNDFAKLKSRYGLNLFSSQKIENENISYLIDDKLWGKGVSTYNNGVFLSLSKKNNYYKRTHNVFEKSKYLGKHHDSLSYWWVPNEQMILIFSNNTLIYKTKFNNVINPTFIREYNDSIGMIINTSNIHYINYKTHKCVPAPTQNKELNISGYGLNKYHTKSYQNDFFLHKLISDFVVINNKMYAISNTEMNLHLFSNLDTDTIQLEFQNLKNPAKFKNILYDENSNNLILSNKDNIIFYNVLTTKEKVFEHGILKNIGINRIRYIFKDMYGHLLVQDYNKLFLFDNTMLKATRLLKNYNLEDALIDVTDNILTVANGFGVLQYTISAEAQISLLHSFPNTKGLLFNEVRNMHVSSKYILIGTDKGSYEIDLTSKKSNILGEKGKRFICNYQDSVFQFKENDTIIITQQNRVLSFDVINPNGYGRLVIKYQLSNQDDWQNANSKEVDFHALEPGYHRVKIQAYDYMWNSDVLYFNLYIKPFWWQTTWGKIIIGSTILLSFVLLLIVVIVITRFIVYKNNERKNQQRNLELKSIYSQINPHFIFNTLSTALYFVKRNENKNAYAHISQFSELLRAYLKASRNKYISIQEEVGNIENYLQLQQTRFEQKFKYNICIADAINADKEQIPSLILQPIVENALNHGIFHKNGVGNLYINIDRGSNNNQIICIVDDDGIGRKKSKEIRTNISKKVDSYGTILIKELVDTFNKYEPVDIGIKYIDKEPPYSGTTVIITVNNNKYGNKENGHNN